MSEIWCPKSDARSLMPEVWCPRSDARSLMPEVWCPKSDARSLMPEVWSLMSQVWCPKSDVPSLMSQVWCPTSDVPSLKSISWCLKFEVWNLMSEIRSLRSKVWCLKSEVWCTKSAVRNPMSEIWIWSYVVRNLKYVVRNMPSIRSLMRSEGLSINSVAVKAVCHKLKLPHTWPTKTPDQFFLDSGTQISAAFAVLFNKTLFCAITQFCPTFIAYFMERGICSILWYFKVYLVRCSCFVQHVASHYLPALYLVFIAEWYFWEKVLDGKWQRERIQPKLKE